MASAADCVQAAETNRPTNPRTSRWSDGPPACGSSDSTPSAAAAEPPLKKPRSDSQLQGSSVGDGPPGLPDGSSGLPDGSSTALSIAATVTATSALASSNPTYSAIPTQNYTYSGSQTYGPGYGPVSGGYGTGGPVSFAPGSAKGNGALFYKTKLCNNYKTGACTFGERCHFAHGVEELRKPPTAWDPTAGGVGGRSTATGIVGQPRKVRMCRYYLEGNCPYGDRCNFLHGNEQVAGTDASTAVRGAGTTWPSYKSRLCAKWERGEACDYGDKCHYAHGHEELQRYSGVAAYPNGGIGMPEMQQTSYNSMMNPPPFAAPYTAAVNYQQPGVSVGVPPANAPSYPAAGVGVQPYAGSQEGVNGTSSAYGYWGASATPIQPVVPSQGYSQTLPWVAAYGGDGSYSGRDGVQPQLQPQPQPQPQLQPQPQPQPQPQQQPQPQPLQQQPSSAYTDAAAQYPQQQQTASYLTSGNASGYQTAAAITNPPYGQGEAKSGDVGYYQASSSYPVQQADYGSGYPVA